MNDTLFGTQTKEQSMKKIIASVVFGLALSTSALANNQPTTQHSSQQGQNFTPAQVKQVENIVHNYLVTNPKVLLEASRALQAQQQKQMEDSALTAVKANKTGLFDDPNSPSIGSKNAPATLVEFFDYQCGHCRQMAATVEKLVSNHKDKKDGLRVIFKELPIFGGMSKYAAQAALASAKQGKYYEFHNMLFAADGPLTKTTVMNIAKQAGLNTKQLKTDMHSPAIARQLAANFQLARALKVMGTPTFVIGNQEKTKFRFIPGATSLSNLEQSLQAVH